MIKSFSENDLSILFSTGKCSPRLTELKSVILRKLDMLDAADILDDLRRPPKNMLEALKGDRAGYHSIRVNQKYRLVFKWTSTGPEEVSFIDYH